MLKLENGLKKHVEKAADGNAWAFKKSGAVQAVALHISRISTGISMLVFFTNSSVMEFQVRDLALFCLFSAIDNFKWF